MKRFTQSLLLALAMLAVATAALAQDSQNSEDTAPPIIPQNPYRFREGRLWLGMSMPDAHSNFWDDNFKNYSASRGQLTDLAFGGDYIFHFDRHDALMLSAGLTGSTANEPARYVLDENGNPLEHHLDLLNLSLTAGYLFYPAGIEHRVIPYLGAGAGIYLGELSTYRSSYTTTTDDCDDDGNCTTETHYVGEQDSFFFTLGGFAVAGLEMPVSSHTAVLLDGRYTVAHAQLGGAFTDNRNLDLSGAQLTVGVAMHF